MKVLVADDDGLIRESLKLILELEDDIEVVGTAETGKQAFEMCGKLRPDIVLMDIRMPVMDGVLGTKLIKQAYENIKIIILTTFRDDEFIKEAIKNGAEGYILKNQSSDNIIESIRAVNRGNSVFQREIANVISSMIKDGRKKNPKDYEITEREFEILKYIGEGLSNKEISQKLYLSEGTVRNYVTELLEKLCLRDRTQLAIFYVKNFE